MKIKTVSGIQRFINSISSDITKIGLWVGGLGFGIVFIYYLIVELFPAFLYPEQLLPGYLNQWNWLGEVIIQSLEKSKLCFIPLLVGILLLIVNQLFFIRTVK